MCKLRSLAAVLTLAVMLGGCNTVLFQQDVAALEAKAATLAAKIKAGITVVADDVKSTLDGVCAQGAQINNGVQQIQSGLQQLGNGPKTAQNIAATNAALTTLNSACAAAPPAGSTTSLIALFKQGWAAYLAAKNAATAATASASNGQ